MRSTALVTVVALTLAAGCSDNSTSTVTAPGSTLDLSAQTTQLYFNGSNANASTAQGTLATTQIDNIIMAATVNWAGPNSNHDHQTVFYNGHGAFSGWGLLVLSPADGYPDGTLAILAGGIVVQPTQFVLPQGQWVEIVATRTNGDVTVRIGTDTQDLGIIPVNPVGGAYSDIERTSVGGDGLFEAPTGDFHGGIKSVVIRRGSTWLERWGFTAGTGTTVQGYNGTTLHLGNAQWM